MKHILGEDDCAPDAFETFEKEFIQITRLSVSDFKNRAVRSEKDDGMMLCWTLDGFELQFAGDSPWHELFKL